MSINVAMLIGAVAIKNGILYSLYWQATSFTARQ
jgi:hypothetical protein